MTELKARVQTARNYQSALRAVQPNFDFPEQIQNASFEAPFFDRSQPYRTDFEELLNKQFCVEITLEREKNE